MDLPFIPFFFILDDDDANGQINFVEDHAKADADADAYTADSSSSSSSRPINTPSPPAGTVRVRPFRSGSTSQLKAVLSFTPRVSSLDRHNAKSQTDEFRGFFTLFWIGECCERGERGEPPSCSADIPPSNQPNLMVLCGVFIARNALI
jgi:hypothetical protein